MAYQKQTWNNYNDSLSIEQNKANNAFATAEGLNHIEDGIKKIDEEVESASGAHPNLSQRLASQEQRLARKVGKGEITKDDFDTSSNYKKIGLINLSEEVQQAMAGTAPVISEVTDKSLVSEKYADKSITFPKINDSVFQGFDFSKTAIEYGYKKMEMSTWENGPISGNTGQNENPVNYRYRTKNFIEQHGDGIKILLNGSDYKIVIYTYELDGTYVGESGWLTESEINLLGGNKKYRFTLGKKDNSALHKVNDEWINSIVYVLNEKMDILRPDDKEIIYKALLNSNFKNGLKYNSEIMWVRGALNESGNRVTANYRIVSENFITPDDDLIIDLKENFRMAYHTYESSGVHLSDSGWVYGKRTKIPYRQGVKYKIVLARTVENYGEVVDAKEFSSNILVAEGLLSISEKQLSPDVNSKLGLIDLIGGKKRYVGVMCQMGNAPQNTLEAIEMSALAGAFGVEMDLRLTKDHQIVLSHIERADAQVNAPGGVISDYTLAELKEYEVLIDGANFNYDYQVKIASLDEALDVCKKHGLVPFIDIKSDGYEGTNQFTLLDVLLEKLKNHRMLNNSVLISPKKDTLLYLRKKAPLATLSVKIYINGTTAESDILFAKDIGGNVLMQCEEIGSEFVSPNVLTQERINKYHKEGLPVKDVDFRFTFKPDNEDKSGNRYWASVKTVDSGLNWTIKNTSPGREITLAKSTYSGFDTLQFAFDNIEKNVIESLLPNITTSGNSNPNIHINAFYDSIAKRIATTFSKNGQYAPFGELPNEMEFTLTVSF